MFQGIGVRIRNGKQEKKKEKKRKTDTKERNSDTEHSWEDNLTEF